MPTFVLNMCQAYYSNCRGVSIASVKLPLSYKEKAYIFDWKQYEKAHTRPIYEPTYHPDPAGHIKQCEDCEKNEEKRNPGHVVEKSSIYRVYCPSREPPSYAPPPYMAPPPHVTSSASSIPRETGATRNSTYLQLPTMSQFAESTCADGFQQQRRRATEVSYTMAQQHTSFYSRYLRSSASNDSPNINTIDPARLLRPPPTPTFLESPYVCTRARAASTNGEEQPIQTPIDSASLLRSPPMPSFLDSPYVCTRGRAASTNSEQQLIQNLPLVAQAFNCRRFNGFSSHEEGSSLETRVLGLRSQWYENELQGPQNSSPWNTFSDWIRKAGEKMTGQGPSRQKAKQDIKV